MAGIAAIYPYGIKVQIVPDDLRARKANLCPADYTQSYIAGLKRLARSLSFDDWMIVEDGETRLYGVYNVEHYQEKAELALKEWELNDPDRYAARWQSALENAEKNVATSLIHGQVTDIPSAAWRYLVAARCVSACLRQPSEHLPDLFSGV